MKKLTFITVSLLIAVAGLLSCKKEYSCEDCIGNNHPPLAVAGPDTVITLPTDSVLLMATSSAIPNGKISAALEKILVLLFSAVRYNSSDQKPVKSLYSKRHSHIEYYPEAISLTSIVICLFCFISLSTNTTNKMQQQLWKLLRHPSKTAAHSN